MEILLFNEKKENFMDVLFALNLLLQNSEKSLVKGKNLLMEMAKKSTIPKRLKELKFHRAGIENNRFMRHMLELLDYWSML